MVISIMGYGKIGSWLAAELAPKHAIRAYDQNPDRQREIPAEIRADSLSALAESGPDMLINAVSLSGTITAFQAVVPLIKSDCILADLASVKGDLPKYYLECGRPFVSVHPMFGPTFAAMSSLSGQNAIIIRESHQSGKRFFRDYLTGKGVKVFDYSFEEHDRMMAYSLTTPFVASLVFTACITSTIVPGTTFARHLAIARGLLAEDDHLLTEILFNDHSVGQLDKITSQLEHLKHIIRGRDNEEAAILLQRLRMNIK